MFLLMRCRLGVKVMIVCNLMLADVLLRLPLLHNFNLLKLLS